MSYSFSGRFLFKDGVLRETAKALLREVYLEEVGGSFGDECWSPATFHGNNDGYRMMTLGGSAIMGHRLMHELFNGPIPDGMFILHSCDNPPCCNPNHLRAGTGKENAQDMLLRGRHKSGSALKTACPQGHAYDEENTYRCAGRRYCRACGRTNKNASAKRRRVALAGTK